MSGAKVESRIAEVRILREALVQLGRQLQPDAPLAQSIDQYQSWISAQTGRINSQRATLGPEFVQELVTRYQENQKEVTRAREALGNHANAIDRTLKELTTAEMRAAEMLMAEDAGSRHQGASDRARRYRPDYRRDSQQPPQARHRWRLIMRVLLHTGRSRYHRRTGQGGRICGTRQLIDLYKAARTVADVEAANGKVSDQVLRVQAIAADLARLHEAKTKACGERGRVDHRRDCGEGAGLLHHS